MRVRYHFIQDRIKKGDIQIEHCGTDKMIANYFTKPLQGRKFEYFRALIMGFDLVLTDGKRVTWETFKSIQTHPSRECVGGPPK